MLNTFATAVADILGKIRGIMTPKERLKEKAKATRKGARRAEPPMARLSKRPPAQKAYVYSCDQLAYLDARLPRHLTEFSTKRKPTSGRNFIGDSSLEGLPEHGKRRSSRRKNVKEARRDALLDLREKRGARRRPSSNRNTLPKEVGGCPKANSCQHTDRGRKQPQLYWTNLRTRNHAVLPRLAGVVASGDSTLHTHATSCRTAYQQPENPFSSGLKRLHLTSRSNSCLPLTSSSRARACARICRWRGSSPSPSISSIQKNHGSSSN